jgi:hypothetical protein
MVVEKKRLKKSEEMDEQPTHHLIGYRLIKIEFRLTSLFFEQRNCCIQKVSPA